MIRRSAAWAGFACAAALLAACSGGSTSTVFVTKTPAPSSSTSAPVPPPGMSSGPPAAQGPPSCATRDLQVYLGLSQGATGHVYQVIDFKNISGRTCTLFGYPGVSFAAGTPATQVGQAADEDPASARVTVTLAPGDVANALMTYLQAGFYPPAKCRPVNTTYLQVFPPNQTTPVYISYSSQICSNNRIHELTIRAVRAGSGGG
jgi:uncharacterized protein DUF4232